MTDLRALKIEAAREALKSVRDGMVLGLGTGSTAEEFVKLLAAAQKKVAAVCTSRRTEDLARAQGINIVALDQIDRIDLAVDGADEVDVRLRLIKGRGGALLREKIVEQAAAEFIVIIDHTKLVEQLGVGPLPVDVLPFASRLLFRRFEALGLQPKQRLQDGDPFVTDDGNHIIDVMVPGDVDIEPVVQALSRFAGVVETGFFSDEATEVIIASPSGLRTLKRSHE